MIRRRDLLGGLASSFAMPSIAHALPTSQLMTLFSAPKAKVIPWSGPLVLNSRLSSEGDSITAGTNGPMWSEFAMFQENASLFRPFGWNNAVGGTTTVQMLARQAAFLATKPRIATFLGGTNDLTGTSDSPAVIAARIQQWMANCFAANVQYIVLCKVLPRTDATWTGLGPTAEANRVALNVLIGQMAVTGKVFVIDLETQYLPSMTVDGLHPNYIGAALLGGTQGFASGITSFLASGLDGLALFNQSGNMLFAGGMNPQLAGTTGTPAPSNLVSGQVATLWGVQTNDTTMTAVCSKVLAPDGTTAAQRIVVSGTCTTAGRVVTLSRTVPYTGVIGQQYEAAIGFSLASGCAGLRAAYLSCDSGQSMNSTQSANVMDGTQAYAGTMRTPAAPLASTRASMNLQAVLTFNAGTVAADMTWWKPWVRQVPAGQ